MTQNGWIKIHRVTTDWEWYKTPNMVQFWIHCLLRANHKTMKWQGQEVLEGQFISGRKQLSIETGLTEKNIRTCIERLKSTNELASKNYSKYSLFTINSWKKYQITNEEGQQNGQQGASKGPAEGHKQELKNEENEKNTLCVFDFWISFPVLTAHKILDDATKKVIEKQLTQHSIEDLIDSIKNYAEILSKPEDYFFKYKFTLGSFFRNGSIQKQSPFKQFLTESDPLNNFKNNQTKKASLNWKD
jgi:hypothetical protein